MKTVLRYLRPKAGIIAVEMCIKLAGTVVELLLPWMLSVILDEAVPSGDFHSVLVWGGLMVLCAALAVVGNVAANRISCATSRDVTHRLRGDLFAKVTRLSCAQEDAFTTPSLISRLTSDTYNVNQMIDRMQRLGVRAPILLLGGIALTLSLEPVLTLVLIATLPLLGAVVWFVSTRGVRLYTRTQAALDVLVRRSQESMAGIRVIQALSKGEYEKARFDEANAQVVDRERRAGLLMNVTNPVMNLLLNAGLTAVVVAGAFRVNAGHTQPGTIIAFLSYFTIILNALMMVSRMFVMYSKGAASGRRIAEVLNAPEELQSRPQPAAGGEEHIRFDHVSFSYGKVEDNLTDISFSLRRGETLGIIGPTGSGKSTILQLLLRFYDPDNGVISVDGKDLRSVEPAALHSIFGVVFQNDFLYADEIGANIDFGRGLPQERLEAAARTAQADFINTRAGGFGAELSPKGANLSGGQKQRVLLARALAADPDILLLDDSSSALDYKTDAALRRALARDFKDTTKIIVAQRISSIRSADRILVLEDGRAVGYGSHDELMRTCGSYREIAEIQMGEVE
ncbi:ABC transporter ATP-binding protein [Anaerofilum sp. BX8]|uniref:ABC transporter ATP-binding protein n=1 Tax=Anaerofilum hominis TaxID=2763016 RepID=A0A923IAN7_9FIRM|nr:ABC transporter ATP-binding protein [Anaerofilum hominis]MBC5581951.1 ABC transporter ATP-binding protein [Anaerofilum hominis]